MKKIFMLMAIAVMAFADTLETKINKMEGMFTGFSQNRIHFHPWDGEVADMMDPSRVTSLTVKPATLINLYTTRNPKAPQEALLTGFAKQKFQFVIDGKPTEIPFRQVNRIERSIDTAEFMRRKRYAETGETMVVRVTDLLEVGAVTVIHFHSDGSKESEDKGAFCEQLCKDSLGKAVYKKIVVSGPTDPLIKRYRLEQLPQFWFFSSRKAVSSRLIEKTETEDIESALKQALSK